MFRQKSTQLRFYSVARAPQGANYTYLLVEQGAGLVMVCTEELSLPRAAMPVLNEGFNPNVNLRLIN